MKNVNCDDPSDRDFEHVEQFMCHLYKDKSVTSLDSMRVNRILTTNRPEEIPPTSDAAKLHIATAFLEAHVWKYTHVPVHDNMNHDLMYTGFELDEEKNILIPKLLYK